VQFRVVFLASVMSSPLLAVEPAAAPGESDLSDVSRDPLKVVYPVVMPPYTYEDDKGAAQGLAVDLLRLWSEKTGKKVEFLLSDWDDSLNNVRHGSADIHSGLFRSDNRTEWFDFSDPFYESSSSLFHLDRQSMQSAERDRNLAGKKIGVLQGSYYEQYLRKERPDVNVVPFSSREKIVQAVVSRETYACLAEDASTSALLNRLGLSGMFSSFWATTWSIKVSPRMPCSPRTCPSFAPIGRNSSRCCST